MKAFRLLCLTAVLGLLLPGLARAAPTPITPSDFDSRMQWASQNLYAALGSATDGKRFLEQARTAMGETWQIEMSPPATLDLRPIRDLIAGVDPATPGGAKKVRTAANLVDEHRRSLAILATAKLRNLPDARNRLDEALKAAQDQEEAGNAISDWFRRLWRRFIGDPQPVQLPDAPEEEQPRPVSWATWIALAIGVAGIGVLGWNLMRTLSDHAGGAYLSLRSGGKTGRADRHLTPDELWAMAREQAAAGDFKEGLRLAHLALLQHLDRSGLLRYIPSQTNREHEGMLRRKQPELARTMHQLNDLVESRLYSGQGATADDFERGESLAGHLWREGDALSKNAQGTTGASSSASSP